MEITDLLIERITRAVLADSAEGKGKGRGSKYTRRACGNQHFFVPLLEAELVEIWLHSCKSHSLRINDSLSFQLIFNLNSVIGANQHSATCVSDLSQLRIWPHVSSESSAKISCTRDPPARFQNVLKPWKVQMGMKSMPGTSENSIRGLAEPPDV